MIRALVEFLFVVVLAMVARAILTSVFRGIGQASANAFQQTAAEAERRQREGHHATAGGNPTNAGVLHKDPVCGTFVSEMTGYSTASAGKMYYFCSANCKDQFKAVPHG